jgi:electron-transferring-flavoprotein dehydrogenase
VVSASSGFSSLPTRLHAPGLVLCGDGAGMVNVPTLKGVHYAVESGRLAAEAVFASLADGVDLGAYDDAVRSSFIWRDLHEVRDMRQAFEHGFFLGGALASVMTVTKGKVSFGRARREPDDAQPLLRTDRASRYPEPDGVLTFDKLSSVFASGNRSRDDQPNHICLQRQVAPDVARMWVQLCPAQVYAVGPEAGDGRAEGQQPRGVMSRSGGGCSGTFQRRKPLSYFSW